MLKRPDPSSSGDTRKPPPSSKPKPKQKPKPKTTEGENEHEVAEALFDLANLAAMAGGDFEAPRKKKQRVTKLEKETGKAVAKRDNGGGAGGVLGGAGVSATGFPGAHATHGMNANGMNANATTAPGAMDPFAAFFSNPAAAAAMANFYGGQQAQQAHNAQPQQPPGWPPGFDIHAMAAALSGAGGFPFPGGGHGSGAHVPLAAPVPNPGQAVGARPPGAMKLCAAHVYIAHFIDYQQQMSRFSVMQKQMDPTPGVVGVGAPPGDAGRGGEAAPATRTTAPEPASDGYDQRQGWPMPPGMNNHTQAMPPNMFPPGAPAGGLFGAHDFQHASQFAALQALMGGHGHAGGGGAQIPPFPFQAQHMNPFGTGMMPPGFGGDGRVGGGEGGGAQGAAPQMNAPFFPQAPWAAAAPAPAMAPVEVPAEDDPGSAGADHVKTGEKEGDGSGAGGDGSGATGEAGEANGHGKPDAARRAASSGDEVPAEALAG